MAYEVNLKEFQGPLDLLLHLIEQAEVDIKDIFISERLGADKPTKKFFDIVFSRIEGFERDKAVIVGDRLSSDILGGINAGIKTCWFNPKRLPGKENIPADYEIHALSELPELLEKI